MEKENKTIEERKKFEDKLRENGKVRLTDDEYNSLKQKTSEDLYANKKEIGTITLKINRIELSGEEVYYY